MPKRLQRTERLRLMKFICSFAWADLEVRDEERAFIAKMMKRLELDEEEEVQVQKWLELPPPPEEIDPTEVPREHRQLFIDAARAMIVADGRISEEEAEIFELFEQLIR